MTKATESSHPDRRYISSFRRWAGIAILAILSVPFVALASGNYRAFQVASISMNPTVHPGDHLIVDARSPVVPSRGDIVALRNPRDPRELLLKRVVAVPTDIVDFIDGYFYLNGKQRVHEPYATTNRVPLPSDLEFVLREGQYFVLGDNRLFSYDSRSFGIVPAADIIGVAESIYWPFNRIGSL